VIQNVVQVPRDRQAHARIIPFTGAGRSPRLPRLGGEGEIIVSQRVVAAIESVFESENVGDLALKRHARPVTAHRFVALRVLACPAVD
jgi:hypothetical protein